MDTSSPSPGVTFAVDPLTHALPEDHGHVGSSKVVYDISNVTSEYLWTGIPKKFFPTNMIVITMYG